MKGDSDVIGYLNKALANELTAIDQYFLHSRIFKDWSFGDLRGVSDRSRTYPGGKAASLWDAEWHH